MNDTLKLTEPKEIAKLEKANALLKKFRSNLTPEAIGTCPASIFGSDMFRKEDMERVFLQNDPDENLGFSKYLGSLNEPTPLASILFKSFQESNLEPNDLTGDVLSLLAKEVEKEIAKKRDTVN